MNREMRRLQAKEEERAKKRRKDQTRGQKKQRVGFRQFLREVRQELKKVAWLHGRSSRPTPSWCSP